MSDLLQGLEAADLVQRLELAPHPEGGYYRETFRDARRIEGGRAASTAIYFLLPAGIVSAWHRVDAAEIWHFYAGAPLALDISTEGEEATRRILGPDLVKDQRPQLVVPAGAWQSAASLGAYTLVGCTVAPGFEFSSFQLAAPDFEPRRNRG
jgi:hypothetical protein